MYKSILWALVLGLALGHSAFAGLVEADWKVAGDGALLQDTNTGLTWLDLIHTRNRSYVDVSANFGVGGDFEGFRYATRSEVIALFSDAGIPDLDVGFKGTAANVPGVGNLIGMWDADLWQLGGFNGKFGYFRTAEVPRPGDHDTGILWLPDDGTGKAEATTGGERFGESPDAEPGATYLGSALVRASAATVPEPASISLLGLGVAALGLLRRHRQ